jgi:hypothetical protein
MYKTAPAELLIVLARYPRPGSCKARLVPLLGPDGAAEIYGRMVRHTVGWVRTLSQTSDAVVQIRYTGGSAAEMTAFVGSPSGLVPQGDGDLGVRLARAVLEAFGTGHQRVAVVGTDCPEMTCALARQAFQILVSHDVVLGPAVDGGYYLIGLSRPDSEFFHGIDWGTDRVLQQTLRIAQRRDLRVSLLPTLTDVDRPEDLPAWERVVQSDPTQSDSPKVSVIIPTLNEEPQLAEVVDGVSAEDSVETIIVGAGNLWDSVSVAARYHAQFVASQPGRAGQLNAGARIATGRVLLFLHADTRVPTGFANKVVELLAHRGVVAGAFRLAIDGAGWPFRLIEKGVSARCQLLQMPYGDQAIFLRRELFHELGGFAELPIMEDFELVRRLRRRGRIAVLSTPVITSGRRWVEQGPWRATWTNQCLIAGYLLGVPCEWLAKWYHGARRGDARLCLKSRSRRLYDGPSRPSTTLK